MVAPSQRTSMPTRTNTVTIPVSWQIGRWPVAHARVDQDLRHGVAGSRRFFAQVGLMHGLDEIDRVVVGDELQGIGDALDQVVLLDHGHGARSSSGG